MPSPSQQHIACAAIMQQTSSPGADQLAAVAAAVATSAAPAAAPPAAPAAAAAATPQQQQQQQRQQHGSRPSRLSAVLTPQSTAASLSPPPSPTHAAVPANQLLLRPAVAVTAAAAATSPKHEAALPASTPAHLKASPAPAAPLPTPPRPAPAAAAAAPAAAPAAPTAPAKPASGQPLVSPSAGSSSNASSDSEAFEQLFEDATACRRITRRLLVLLLLAATAGLVLTGLLLQLVLGAGTGAAAARYQRAFPWLYFAAAFPPLALAWRWLCWQLHAAAEYTSLREMLYFLTPLRGVLASLLFWLTVLLWFQVCFKWLWCQSAHCEAAACAKALHIVWRVLVCVALWSGANALKCATARLLSLSFWRTAHFEKVRLAIERELFLIRLSQARSTLLPPAPAPPGEEGELSDRAAQPPAGSGWGSVLWAARRTSQLFAGLHLTVPEEAEEEVEAAAAASDAAAPACSPSSKAAAAAGDRSHHSGREHALLAGADAAVRIELKDGSSAGAAAQKQQQQIRQQPSPPPPSAAAAAAAGAALAAAASDDEPLLPPRQLSSSPMLAGLRGDAGSKPKAVARPPLQQHRHQQQPVEPPPASFALGKRQPSYELFAAERVPSILRGSRPSSLRSGTSAFGSSHPAYRGRGTGSKLSSSTARRVSLQLNPRAGMVEGVGGLLLQPEVLQQGTAAGAAAGQGAGRQPGQPMTEAELDRLRSALGVNTYSALVDRYHGMTAQEEAEHQRHVRRFATGLFANVLGDAERDHLLPEDFLLFFQERGGSGGGSTCDEEAARQAFAYFDRNGDGAISCAELQESALEMLSERKHIAASIKDTESVVNSLETGLGMLVHVITIALYLLVWGVNIVQGFTTFSATFLAFTFVFGNSVSSVFEAALFLFIVHPYDVGDALLLPSGMLARVKKIDLQFTVLLRSDGQMQWTPNTVLRTQPLVNLSRSGPRWEGYTWLVDLDTPEEVLTRLAAALAAHVATQPSHFKSAPSVTWRALEEPLKLRLAVGVTYSFTGEDAGRYVAARHGILAVVRRELHTAGVKYTAALGAPTAAHPTPPAIVTAGA